MADQDQENFETTGDVDQPVENLDDAVAFDFDEEEIEDEDQIGDALVYENQPGVDQVENDILNDLQREIDVDLSAYEFFLDEDDAKKLDLPAQETVTLPYQEEFSLSEQQAARNEAIEQLKGQIRIEMNARGFDEDEIESYIQSESSNLFSTTGFGGQRLLSSNPTNQIFNVHLNAEMMKEHDGWFDKTTDWFKSDVGADALIRGRDLHEAGDLEYTNEANRRFNELIKEGNSEDIAHELLAKEFTDKDEKFEIRKLNERQKELRDLGLFKVTDSNIDKVAATVGGMMSIPTAYKTAQTFATFGSRISPEPRTKAIATGSFGLLGLAVGGIGGFTLGGGIAKNTATGAFDYVDEDDPIETDFLRSRRQLNHNIDLVQAIVDDFGVIENTDTFLKVASARSKAAFITKVLTLADEYGVSNFLKDSPNLKSFLEFAATDVNYLEKLADKANIDKDGLLYAAMQTWGGNNQFMDTVFPHLKIAQIAYHPNVTKIYEEAVAESGLTKNEQRLFSISKNVGEFASQLFGYDVDPSDDDEGVGRLSVLLTEIIDLIGSSDQYREDVAAQKQKQLDELRKAAKVESRKRTPSPLEQQLEDEVSKEIEGLKKLNKYEENLYYNAFIDSHNWNSANPEWRGEQPDVDTFIKFTKSHLKYGGKEEFSDLHLTNAVKAVINSEPKEEIQKHLNMIGLGTVSAYRVDNVNPVWKRPSEKQIKDFGLSLYEAQQLDPKGGRKGSKAIQRALLPTMISQKGYGTTYEPSDFQNALQWFSILPIAGSEVDTGVVTVPDTLKPLFEHYGLPIAYGTPAALDFYNGLNLRPIDSDSGQRIKARRLSGTGGFQLGYQEVMYAMGWQKDDWRFGLFNAAAFAMDMVNFERHFGRFLGNTARIGLNTRNLPGAFKSTTPNTKLITAKNTLLQGTSYDRTVDPVIQQHQVQKDYAQHQLNNGINPLDDLTAADRDLWEDTFRLAGRNPSEIYQAFEMAARQNNTLRPAAERLKRQIGPNEIYVLRADPDYKRLKNDVYNLVRKGKIQEPDAARFMSLIEHQATIIADIPDSPFKFARDVIANTEVVTNRPPGVGARFMGKGLEETDASIKDVPTKPLSKDHSTDRIRLMLLDVNIDENDPAFIKGLNKRFDKASLDELSEPERILLKEDIFAGKVKSSPVKELKPISGKKIKELRARYKFESYSGVPGPLTKTSKSQKPFKFEKVAQGTSTKNAAASFELGDQHRGQFKNNPILNNSNWNQYWGGITKTRQVLELPNKVRSYADPEKMAAELRRLTPEQKRRADSGIVLVEQLGALYETGRAEAKTTAQLIAWTILSRSLSAFPHESAFLDIFLSAPDSTKFSAGLDDFIQMALDGEFGNRALKEFDIWVGGIHRRRAADDLLAAGEVSPDEYRFLVGQDKKTVDSLLNRKIIDDEQAQKFLVEPLPNTEANKEKNKQVAKKMAESRKTAEHLRRQQVITDDEFKNLVGFHPALRIEGMGNPAAANLRSFGQNFLFQSSEILPENKPLTGLKSADGVYRKFDFGGQTKLSAWHQILLDQSISGQEARRLFHQIYEKSGVDNKVISFMLLAAGRKDVIVIDRIQANHFWGALENALGRKVIRKDGSKIDLYEGFKSPGKKDDDFKKWARNPGPHGTTRGLADVLAGARGALLYEAIEDILSKSMDDAYRLAGREGEASLGRFHWETWVINSGQEVGHDTLNVILKQAQGFDDPAVGAFVSEGKFQQRRYGMKYAVLPNGEQAMVMATQNGDNYLFSPQQWANVISKLEKDGANVGAADDVGKIVPRGWKLQDEKFENTPWYNRASVDRDNLDTIIRKYGTRATDEQTLALERYTGKPGVRSNTAPRSREAATDEVTFLENTDYAAFEKAKNENSRPENLAPKTMEDYEGSRIFMIDSKDAGFLVKDGDLQNVFNNSGISGLATEGVKLAIETYDAKTLDCYDGFLPKYYSKAGFVEVARIDWDDQYAPPNWNYYTLGRPDVVIMSYQGGDPALIRSRYGRYEHKRTNNRVTDFEEAQALARREVRDSGDPRGVEGMGSERTRGGVGGESLRRRVGADETPDPVEPTVLRLIDPESTDTKFQRKKGVPLGYFEYDQRTRVSIINLFEKGDIDTLWHENGHFMATLMGEKYKNTLFRFFDHEIDSDGSRKLTDQGHEQFAESWRYYRRTKDNPNGYLRRLLDELYVMLHNFWSKLRRKPQLLPDEVRQYWDLEFGELPNDRRSVDSALSGAAFKRPRYVRVTEGDVADDASVSRAQVRVSKLLGYDEHTIRSLLGDRRVTKVVSQPDLQVSPGRQPSIKRVVERTYESRRYDAIDAGLEIIALIKNTDFRKNAGRQELKSIGSGRYHVSKNILSKVTKETSERFFEALGIKFDELQKMVFQPGADGKNSLSEMSSLPPGITRRDVAAFQRRLSAQDLQKDPKEHRSTISFLLLDDRQQAGLKTLIQEISNQPEADIVPFSLMDPNANLKIVSVTEMNHIRNALYDIAATPLNRRSRNQIDPGFFAAMSGLVGSAAIVETVGDALRRTGEFFGKRKVIPDDELDPDVVDILNGFGRMMISSGDELIKSAEDMLKKGTLTTEEHLWNFAHKYVDNVRPRVNLAHLNNLERLYTEMSGLIRDVESDAKKRVAQQPTGVAVDPITYDPFVSGRALTIEYIGRSLPVIQDLLDGVNGMYPQERQAIIAIRSLYDQIQRGRSIDSITQAERAILADAIEHIHVGIREKHQHVVEFSKGIYERFLAVENVASTDYRPQYAYTIYKNFFTGNFTKLFEMAESLKNIRKVSRYSRKTVELKFLNTVVTINEKYIPKSLAKRLGTDLPKVNVRLVSLLLFLKMDEVKNRLSKELVDKGYDSSRRGIIENLYLSSSTSVSRERYLDRVQFYVNRILQFNNLGKRIVDEDGKTITKQEPIGVSEKHAQDPKTFESGPYGPAEVPSDYRADAHIIRSIDLNAQHEAEQILSRAGMNINRGTLERVLIGDKTFYLPKTAVDFIEDHVHQTYPKARFKKSWGKYGDGEYQLTGETPSNVVLRVQEVASTIGTVVGYLVSPRAFYHGLLIGSGGLPMVGYGMGVFIGGLSQIHLGQGVRAAVSDLLTAGPEMAEALPGIKNISASLDKEINFAAGVLARLHGKGAAKIKTKPLVLPDGRIYTADMIAEGVYRNGWRSAFIDLLKNQDTLDQFHELLVKSNPEFSMAAVGALGGVVGAGMTGVPTISSAALSAALFGGVGYATKPGNIFSKLHRAYRESFAAIDTYLRLQVLIREMKRGLTLDEAAKNTRDIMLDYSSMSDLERNYIGRYFAFWSYYAQANKLFFNTALKNPDRIITQLKLARSTQLQVTEGRDPDKFLAPWDRYRTFLPFKIGGQYFRTPFLISGDTMGLAAEGFTSVFGSNEESRKAWLAISSRLSPQIGLGVATILGVDPGRGFPLERATLQVPAELIEMDRLLFGSALYDYLDIKHIPAEDIRHIWDEKEKRRISTKNIERPGMGIWVSQKPARYYYLMNYLQTPLTGRMGDNMWAISRSNAGVIESAVDGLEYIKDEFSPDRPIMSNFGVLNALSLFKGKDFKGMQKFIIDTKDPESLDPRRDLKTYTYPSDIVPPGQQINTAPIDLLRATGIAVENEDGSVDVFTDQFYWTELARALGFTAVPKTNFERPAAMEVKAHQKRVNEEEKKKKQEYEKLQKRGGVEKIPE